MRVLLAPMEGVLDALVRELLTEVNDYDLCITEFVRVVDQLLPVKVFHRICGVASCQPHAVRHAGAYSASGPASAVAGGKRRAGDGVGIVWRGPELRLSVKSGERQRRRRDIAQRSRTHLSGAKAMRAAVPSHLPVTVKVRLGWDSGDRKFEIADAVQQAGASELVVHGRTKAQATAPSISTGRRSVKYASV